jgi:hypothetical protein
MKYGAALSKRRHRILKWADKQISRTLARSVTNPEQSTLTQDILKFMDSFALPWALDSTEIHMLLGRQEGMRCVYTTRERDKHTFAVFFDNDDHEHDDDAPIAPPEATEARREVPRSPCDTSEDESASESGEEDARDGRASKAARSEATEDEDETWTETMQSDLDFALKHPVSPTTRFVFRKIHKVTLFPDPTHAAKLVIMCDCGYAPRIGLACYHIWCFLFTIIKAIPKSIGDGAGFVQHICECLRRPTACQNCRSADTFEEFSWSSHPSFVFEDMFNMSIVSKVKYHAVVRPDVNANALFSGGGVQHNVFHPRMSAQLFREFSSHNNPEGTSRVPKAGLPDRDDESDESNDDCDDRQDQSAASASRSSSRSAVPTLRGLEHLLQGMWDRTARIKDKKQRADARRRLQSKMQEANEEIHSLHVESLPKQLHRYHSVRDRMLGLPGAAPGCE